MSEELDSARELPEKKSRDARVRELALRLALRGASLETETPGGVKVSAKVDSYTDRSGKTRNSIVTHREYSRPDETITTDTVNSDMFPDRSPDIAGNIVIRRDGKAQSVILDKRNVIAEQLSAIATLRNADSSEAIRSQEAAVEAMKRINDAK